MVLRPRLWVCEDLLVKSDELFGRRISQQVLQYYYIGGRDELRRRILIFDFRLGTD